MPTTKIYKNTSKKMLNVPGVGELKAGDQVSITSEYHQPVIVENFPGLVDLAEQEQKEEK